MGPEDVFLLERRPHFRGCYVQASMELGPEDVSLLERYPFRYKINVCKCTCIYLPPLPETFSRLGQSCPKYCHTKETKIIAISMDFKNKVT